MSIEALMQAAVARLIDQVEEFTADNCGIQPQGHPPPRAGDFYVSVDEGTIVVKDPQNRSFLAEYYNIAVWVSLRAGLYPMDSTSAMYLASLNRLTDLERKVITNLHGKEEVRRAANVLLGISEAAQDGDASAPGGDGSFGDALQWPIWYVGRGATVVHDSQWAGGGSHPEGGDEPGGAWQVRQLGFYGGWRIQNLSIMK